MMSPMMIPQTPGPPPPPTLNKHCEILVSCSDREVDETACMLFAS